ncbi:MAG: MATE family efflux transporter [Clostridia bacterium]|nr:MATE family efflux transporter [Clostridia bacterium]MBR0027961.1 MATE family efflux transporter [Clostridia bacterium]
MGTMPINKLLISMALPMVISMLVQAMYNIVDSIFVSRLSENALTAVSMAFPMQSLMFSVAAGIGVGMNALLSRSLGQKNFKAANKAAMNGMFLEAIGAFLFILVGIFLVEPFFRIQTDNPEIIDLGISYTRLCMVLCFGIYGQFTFERILQSTGRTFYTMITQLVGAVINIILDPIMIFGLLGFPKLGVAGAALATVIGQIFAAALAFILNKKKNPDVQLEFKGFRPENHYIKTILAVGIPSIIMASVGSVMTFGMNLILGVYLASSTAVAVFGVYFKLNSFIFMPVFGLNNGMVPIVSYNYGARNRKRLMDTIKFSIIYAVALMLIGLALFQFIPDKLLALFNASEDMLAIGVPALRIISLSFSFAGVCIIIVSTFQALGHGFFSMFVSIARQLVVLLPSAFILAAVGGLQATWWSFPIAEIASLTLSLVFFKHLYDKIIKPLDEPEKAE